MNQEPLVQIKEIGLFLDRIGFAEAIVLKRQRT